MIYSFADPTPGLRDGFCDSTLIFSSWGNSFNIIQVDTDGNSSFIDSRSPFEKDKIFVSAYSKNVFFYDHAYYDLDLNIKIDLSKYNDKIIGGGPFQGGYAPLYICGADGKDYFTIIDSQGNELFEPTPGSPAKTFSDGYLVVKTDVGCAVYDTQGEKVLESPYNMLGNITSRNIHTVWNVEGTVSKVIDGFFVACEEGSYVPNIFVGIDGSCIGK